MHTQPLPESAGTFREPEDQRADCPYCRGRACVIVTLWDSHCGGFTDAKLECQACGKVRWIDGPDA